MAKGKAKEQTPGQELANALREQTPEPVETPVDSAPVAETVADPPQGELATDSAAPSAPETVAEPGAGAAEKPWWSSLETMGFRDVDSEESARTRLIEGYRLREQEAREAQERLHRLELEQAARAVQTPNSPNATVEKPAESAKPWWSPPEINRAWFERYIEVKTDDKGQVTKAWKSDTPADVRQKADQYAEYLNSWQDRILTDPESVYRDWETEILRKAEERFSALYGSRQQEQFQQTYQQEFESINPWLFEVDPVTNTHRRDREGKPVLSEDGRQYRAYEERAAQIGIQDVEERSKYALGQMVLEGKLSLGGQAAPPVNGTNGTTAPAPQDAARIAEQKRQDVLKRARGGNGTVVPNRGGTFPADDDHGPQNRNQTPGRQLLAELQLKGIPLPLA